MSIAFKGDVQSVLKHCGKLDDELFPGRVAKCVIINAPLLFNGAWKVIKLFLSEATKNKIEIIGKP